MRGWLALRHTRPATVPVWRLASFLAGLLALFVAISSPLDTFSETLLFMHMAQHFVLMSVAPPLIVMGSPFVPILRGLSKLSLGWMKIGILHERIQPGVLSRTDVMNECIELSRNRQLGRQL
jgi:cytochrome c oxidase assembly factor CtaG